MKAKLFLCAGLMVTILATAQDVIVTTNSQKIDAKILEVSKSVIKYKEYDNPDGPIFSIETSDINSIIYSTGKVVLYNQSTKSSSENQASLPVAGQQNPESQSLTQQNSEKSITNNNGQTYSITANQSTANESKFTPCYQGYLEASGVFTKAEGGFGIDVINGRRLAKPVFLGGGIGFYGDFSNYLSYSAAILHTPIFADLRVFIPTKKPSFYPYIGLSLGPTINYYQRLNNLTANEVDVWAFFRLNAGIDIKRFTLGIGYELWGNKEFVGNFGFIKLGVRIGKVI